MDALLLADIAVTEQKPELFPNDLDSKFDHYLGSVQPFRSLPIGDYKIISKNLFKTKDSRDCMILVLLNKSYIQTKVFAPDSIRQELMLEPHRYNYLRNLGLKESNSSGNQYFDFKLA